MLFAYACYMCRVSTDSESSRLERKKQVFDETKETGGTEFENVNLNCCCVIRV
jgi:hypothetical protein